MDAPDRLTIVNGALAMDGGSVWLDAIDGRGCRHSILLGWSIAAQREKSTALVVADVRLEKGSTDEMAWIGAIAEARIDPIEMRSSGDQLGPQRIILAKDAETILAAGATGMIDGLTALRDSLLQKIRSSIHTAA